MPNKVEKQLVDSLFHVLQSPNFTTLSTVDFETGAPNVSSISWVLAKTPTSIYIAVDNRSRIVANIKANQHVVLTLIADGSVFAIAGTTELIVPRLDNVPLKLALLKLNISEVRDIMFYGSKIVQVPVYDKTYDKVAAEKLDRQVLAAMKIN